MYILLYVFKNSSQEVMNVAVIPVFLGQLSDAEAADRCVDLKTGTTIRELNSEFLNSLVLVNASVFINQAFSN